MEFSQDKEYTLSDKLVDVAKILAFLEKVLPPSVDAYDDKTSLDEILLGVAAMTRILSNMAETAASECNELEESWQEVKTSKTNRVRP